MAKALGLNTEGIVEEIEVASVVPLYVPVYEQAGGFLKIALVFELYIVATTQSGTPLNIQLGV